MGVRETYLLASITQRELDELRNNMHNSGGGYNFYRDASGELTIIRSSQVGSRTTEPEHREAIHAVEIRRLRSTGSVGPERPYQVYLVHLNDKTLREDHITAVSRLEGVLGRPLTKHREIVSLLKR